MSGQHRTNRARNRPHQIEAQASPTDDAAAASMQPAQAVPAVNEQPMKKRKVTLGTLLGGRVTKEPASTPKPDEMEDELEQYLDDSEEPNLDIKVLSSRRASGLTWRRW